MQALGLIETKGLIAAIESADAMLKAADVKLLEKTIVGGGLVSIVVTGDVGAVKAAVEAGSAAVRKIDSALLISEHVIPRPHHDIDSIILSSEKKSDEITSEIIEESTAEVVAEVLPEALEATAEDLTVEASETNELQIDSSELLNKEKVDNMMLKCGLEEVIEALSKLKVIELRLMAREYKDFGIAGRQISKAGKKLLLDKFRKYYELKNK